MALAGSPAHQLVANMSMSGLSREHGGMMVRGRAWGRWSMHSQLANCDRQAVDARQATMHTCQAPRPALPHPCPLPTASWSVTLPRRLMRSLLA